MKLKDSGLQIFQYFYQKDIIAEEMAEIISENSGELIKHHVLVEILEVEGYQFADFRIFLRKEHNHQRNNKSFWRGP